MTVARCETESINRVVMEAALTQAQKGNLVQLKQQC